MKSEAFRFEFLRVPTKAQLLISSQIKNMSMLTINEERSGLSVGFFFKHLSTKSLILSEKILLGNFGAG